ncbi:MAG: sensor histidine kinase [Nocardioides sp.]
MGGSSSPSDPRQHGAGLSVFGWRIAVAARALCLVLAAGYLVIAQAPTQLAGLAGLLAIATIGSAADLGQATPRARLIPVVEAATAAAVISLASDGGRSLLPYLLAPPLAAGVRASWTACLVSGMVSLSTLVAGWLTGSGGERDFVLASLPWLAVGVAAGLMASWQIRSFRQFESAQAPYLAAHRLMTQLHRVSQQLGGGLDTRSIGAALVRDVMTSGLAARVLVFVGAGDTSLSFLTGNDGASVTGPEYDDAERARRNGSVWRSSDYSAFPVRVGDRPVGVAVVQPAPGLDEIAFVREVSAIVDGHGVPLDTALMFDDVRSVATSEERQRLAREIHDGVAQDIASLGYAIDELSATTTDPRVGVVVAVLRKEVTRVVSELRHSVFDLRNDRLIGTDFATSLREYVNEAAQRNNLEPMIRVRASGPPLAGRVADELLRITQEAVSNVRKHAQASGVWVEFSTNGRWFELVVSDDGPGSQIPQPRPGHYGLATMRERAARIDAVLTLEARRSGGTTVRVRSHAQASFSAANGVVNDHGDAG